MMQFRGYPDRNYTLLKEGKFYRTYGGEIVGPMRKWNGVEDMALHHRRVSEAPWYPTPTKEYFTDGSGRCWENWGGSFGAHLYLCEFDINTLLEGTDYEPSKDHEQAFRYGSMR